MTNAHRCSSTVRIPGNLRRVAQCQVSYGDERPETQVTDRTGHIGYTFPNFFSREVNAL